MNRRGFLKCLAGGVALSAMVTKLPSDVVTELGTDVVTDVVTDAVNPVFSSVVTMTKVAKDKWVVWGKTANG